MMQERAPQAVDCPLIGTIVRRPWLVTAACLALSLIIALGAIRLEVDANARAFLVEGSPEKVALDNLEAAYSKDESVIFVIAPANGDVFSREALVVIDEITQAAWRVPHTRRVDSLTNFQHVSAQGDEVEVRDLVSDPAHADERTLARAREIALDRPDMVGRLVAPDGRVAAVHLTSSVPVENHAAVKDIADAARTIAAEAKARHASVEVRLTGLVMLDTAMAEASDRDAATLVPLMFALILVIVGVTLRSVIATALSLVIIILSIAVALGVTGWWGVSLNPASSAAPIIILTLVVSNCMHLLATYRFDPAHIGMVRAHAVASALQHNLKPFLICNGTTVAGFLTLNFSAVAPFRELGNIVACGVTAGFLLSVTLLPALMTLVPIRRPSTLSREVTMMDAFGRTVVRHRVRIAAVTGLVALGLVFGITRIEFDDNFVHYFDDSYSFRTDTDFAERSLSGITVFEYAVPAAGPGGVADPGYLTTLDRFAVWLRGQEHVRHVLALPDQIKRINEAMRGGDPSERRIPDERETAAQMLLLYELSLPFGLDLTDRIRVDKSGSRVTVITDNVSSATTKAMADAGSAWLERNAPAYMQVRPTGLSYTFAHVSEQNIKAMLRGSLLALASISAMLLVPIGNLRVWALSLVPNLLPVTMALGLWGYLVGHVNLAVSVVGTMTLGIVVDDTVHFLTRYLAARRAGADLHEAALAAFRSVGVAMVATSVALVVGFGVLASSGFAINANMGLLAAVTIALALAGDLVLLPALLTLFDARSRRQPAHAAPEASRAAGVPE